MDIPLHVTTTDLDTMLRAVLLDPGDDLARLAYADTLEEVGQIERAEFVRLQVAIWEAQQNCRCGRTDGGHRTEAGGQHTNGGCAGDKLRWPLDPDGRSTNIKMAELGLLGKNVSRVKNVVEPQYYRWGSPAKPEWLRVPGFATRLPGGEWSFRRGFVESISLPLDAFMAHAEELFGRHPIAAVTLTDRDTWRHSGMAGYWRAEKPDLEDYDDDDLPPDLFDALVTLGVHVILVPNGNAWIFFDTPELAHAALSAACVAYGRRQAGLPPLPVHPTRR